MSYFIKLFKYTGIQHDIHITSDSYHLTVTGRCHFWSRKFVIFWRSSFLFSGDCVVQCSVFCVVFWRLLFISLIWSLHWLSFYLRFLITPMVYWHISDILLKHICLVKLFCAGMYLELATDTHNPIIINVLFGFNLISVLTYGSRHGHGRMVGVFTTNCPIIAYNY